MITNFKSKLPAVGNTIFSTMSALAVEHNAINLGQGFADYAMPAELIDLVAKAMRDNHNQYAPMPGVLALRERIAQKIKNLYGATIDVQSEITITPGGTYGIYTALTTLLQPGDEAIVLEPAYDSYIPNIIASGAKPVVVSLQAPLFQPNWEVIGNAITPATKAIVINTPHNPTGYCFTEQDWKSLAALVANKNIVIISDEVYEHIAMDGKPHQSILRYTTLFEHYFAIFSFGKVYHNTGWKIGYCVAPKNYTAEFRKIHQYLAFSINTPMQIAIAEYLQNEKAYLELPSFFQRKRDLLLEALRDSKFEIVMPSQGSFFQTISFKNISTASDMEFATWLTKEKKVTTIPLSAFYSNATDDSLIRLCFAKKDETILAAAELLKSV
jgi:methionine transaminase